MNAHELSRRELLARTGLLAGGALALAQSGVVTAAEPGQSGKKEAPFKFCLNTATIRGQKVGIVKEIEIASQAGYDAIEPWVDTVQDYVRGGGSAKDLRKRIEDSGISVESSIGFPEWIVDDDARRAKGMERAKREMDLMAQIGAKRFASPPAGATDLPKLDLLAAAARYRALLEIGDGIGIVPQLELWGFSKNLSRLGECVNVAIEAAHPKSCVLADAFHLHKGGSDYHGLGMLGPGVVQTFHMNDFPNDPPREKIDDSFRVYPGDGEGPIVEMLRALRRNGGQKVLSLEVFNRKYWSEDAQSVAKTGLGKLKAVAAKAAA
jgi:sugar phosphate isomerase/epimerase